MYGVSFTKSRSAEMAMSRVLKNVMMETEKMVMDAAHSALLKNPATSSYSTYNTPAKNEAQKMIYFTLRT